MPPSLRTNDATARTGDTTLTFLADLIQQDLDHANPDTDRETGFLLQELIKWRAGNGADILDPSGNAIDVADGNKVAELFLKPGIFDAVSTACKSKFIQLHPDNWQLFIGVDAKAVVERILKKVLPLTNVESAGREARDVTSPSMASPSWLQKILARFAGSQGAIPLATMVIDIIANQLDHFTWAMHLLDVLDATLQADAHGHGWFLIKASGLLQECKTAAKRHVFAGILKKNGKCKELIDSLLRAGSLSEDKGEDVLDLLETMDREAVATFLNQDARVVHLNYFLRLHACRTEPVKQRKLPVAQQNKITKRTALQELDETIALLSKRQDPDSRALLTSTLARREDLVKGQWQDGSIARILKYIQMTNPWALDRQFTSWGKRISDAALDPEKINAMKGFITKHLDATRHAMKTSDELASMFGKRYLPLNSIEAAGARHVEIKFDALAGADVHRDVEKIITSAFPLDAPRPAIIHLLDFGNAPSPPLALPAEFKDCPWFMLHEGEITGVGLSNSRLKVIPEALLHLSKLKILDLSNNVIKQIDAMGSWPALQHLDLSRNLLSSFAPGGPSLRVKCLDLHCNVLKDVDMTFASHGLKVLDLSRNQITKMAQVKGLKACQKLGIVNLAWNKLDNLQEFPAMNRLVILHLNGNGLVKLGNDTTLPSVRRLDVSDNNLGALKGISNFPAVFHVDARKNYLKNVSEIDTMPHLQEFLASSNQIVSLGNLLRLIKIRLVDLRANPLSDLQRDEDKARYLLAPFQRGA